MKDKYNQGKVGFPKTKKVTYSKAKEKAWKAFSLYIRKRASNNMGMTACYTCGAWKHYKELQAGHGIPGRNNAVLFMEEVVRPQCSGCNIWGRGKLNIFTLKLIKELGAKEYERLVEESNQTLQYKVNDLLELERYYKENINA